MEEADEYKQSALHTIDETFAMPTIPTSAIFASGSD